MRSADPEPQPAPGYVKPAYHSYGYVSPVYHSYGYKSAPAYKSYSHYPTHGYGYGVHSHHKRSADPEPEASSVYGKPVYHGRSYVKPVYHSYGYPSAPVYKSYSHYPTHGYGYGIHHHHKRSADPEPEPSKAYGLYNSYYKPYPVYHPAPYHHTP